MNDVDSLQPAPTYRIGAVSRLTGIAPDTLRVWERRYGTVVPIRTPKGSRLYSQDDIARLALIKRLVDDGDAISRVANLSKDELQERAKGAPSADLRGELGQSCRVAVLGKMLSAKLANVTSVDDQLDVVGLFEEKDAFLAQTPELHADVVILEYETIQPEQIREIGRLLLRSNCALCSARDRLGSPTCFPTPA